MNVSLIPLLSQIGVTAVSAVSGVSPLSRPPQTFRNNGQDGIPYVAFGDSLTTGSSIQTCRDNRTRSLWGCWESPTAAVPYPARIAESLGYRYSNAANDHKRSNLKSNPLDLYRVGTWGYTVQEAAHAGDNPEWLTQLEAISKATQLVTGSLGINDLQFSNVSKWAKLYLSPGRDKITPAVKAEIAARDRDFDALFKALNRAKRNGATVVIGLYYNPFDTNKRQCADLRKIGHRIVEPLDQELIKRAHRAGFDVADFRPQFEGHGAGSEEPYVFGTECSITGALKISFPAWMKKKDVKRAIGIAFDPHPNNRGTQVMANKILGEFNNAD